jgi:pimeloyl-ACP methyl ester carboxylesterase
MHPTSIRVSGANGLSLQLLEWSQEGPALLFLHGFDNDAHVWDEFAPTFAPYYRTLALDQRGHGDSDWDPKDRYDHETMAQDVEHVLDALGIKRVALIGHSLGGRVSMRFAGRNPERLSGLVLVDCGPELDARGVTRIQLETQSSKPSFGSVQEFEDILARRYPEAAPTTLARLAQHWLRERPDGRFEPKTAPNFGRTWEAQSAEEARSRMQEEADRLWDALKLTSCPTLVIRGAASDVLDPDTAERMVDEALPNGRLEVIPRAGHSVMLDNPAGFLAGIARFALADA